MLAAHLALQGPARPGERQADAAPVGGVGAAFDQAARQPRPNANRGDNTAGESPYQDSSPKTTEDREDPEL